MAQRVKEMVSEEIIDESTVKKEVEEAKKELQAEIKEAQEEDKNDKEDKEDKKNKTKKSNKPVRGKKYQAAHALIDQNKFYTIEEGIDKVLETTVVKFDPTIEVHAKLTISGIRGTMVLPASAPKEKRVAIADDKTADEIVAAVKAGKIDFDILIATPSAMPKLVAVAKILGPKGMMPSPKSGTVVENTKTAVEEIKSGKVEYKQDDQKNIHLAIAKASFGKEKIKENLQAFLKILPKNKVLGIFLASSMGPSVKIEIPK